jgi:D-serine deaminase-like pyridoxal phosphate-dependent protein
MHLSFDFRFGQVVISIYLTSSIIGNDSNCGVQKRSVRKQFAAFKRYAANCTAIGVEVFPKFTDERHFPSESTAGGNSTTESTAGGNFTTESTAGGNSTTESTAGGNSTTESTAGGNSTSSASHASAVVAILFAIILN